MALPRGLPARWGVVQAETWKFAVGLSSTVETESMRAMELPSAEAFEEAAALADALVEAARHAPLAGPAKSATKEVREWAEATGASGADDELLRRYNEAASSVPEELRAGLLETARGDLGRRAVLLILSRTGTSDALRLIALDVLAQGAESGDAEELARVNIRQRPEVLGKALDVLAGTGSTVALFALSKVFAQRGDELADQARSLAADLWTTNPVASAARDPELSSRAGEALADPSQALYAVLAMETPEQASMSASESGRALLEAIGPQMMELDERLRDAGRASSLSAFHARLRDELLELALIAGVPADSKVQERALENLFRRQDLGDVADLAPSLPGPAIGEYARRALAKENRRGSRADRAQLALELLRERDASLRSSFRDLAVECLSEDSPELRFEAARLLAVDQDSLEAKTRAALGAAYEDLPPHLQSMLARHLRGSVVRSGPRDIGSFLRWVRDGGPDEIEDRLSALFERWAGDDGMASEDVEAFMDAFGALFTELPSEAQPRFVDQLVTVSAGWLRARRGRLAQPLQALLSWARYRAIVSDHYGRFAELLLADQARALLGETLRIEGTVVSELLQRAAQSDLNEDFEGRLLLPVLASAVQDDPKAASTAIGASDERAQRRLLAAGVLAGSDSREEAARLAKALAERTTERFEKRRRAVLAALDEMEEASAGNEGLGKLVDEVRNALLREDGESPAGEDDGSMDGAAEPADVPEAVLSWRQQAANRFGGVVELDGEGRRQTLTPRDDLLTDGEALIELVSQLDRRAYSKRVAPPSDRPYYRRDLERVLAAALKAGAIEKGSGGEPVAAKALGSAGPQFLELINRPATELRTLFWSLWADREGADANSDLRSALLEAASDSDRQQAAGMLAAASASRPEEVREAAQEGVEVSQVLRPRGLLRVLVEVGVEVADELEEPPYLGRVLALPLPFACGLIGGIGL